jgi:L-lactate dehydrogenase complex protein LldE
MTTRTSDTHVYLFGTCLIDLLYPDAGMASIELLQNAGIKVIFPPDQSCCGQPAFNSGFRNEAREVARKQLDCFPKKYPVIVPSASCAGMMIHHWPELFAGDPDEERACEIAARVYEFTEYLVDHLDYQPLDKGEATSIAIHSSCSALREMGVADRIEKLCSQLEHVTTVEQAYKTECCGFGGTFAVKQPEISGAMVTDKAASIRDTGAPRLISQDCGCLMNIGGVFEKQGKGPKCQHIAEFLLERSHGS